MCLIPDPLRALLVLLFVSHAFAIPATLQSLVDGTGTLSVVDPVDQFYLFSVPVPATKKMEFSTTTNPPTATVTMNGLNPNNNFPIDPHRPNVFYLVVSAPSFTPVTYTIVVRPALDAVISAGAQFSCLLLQNKVSCWGVMRFFPMMVSLALKLMREFACIFRRKEGI